MALPLAALFLAAAVDGEVALGHASALAALGPHPFGSPRDVAAAEFVAAELREAGLGEVRLQEFESGGRKGKNVLGVLRGPGPEFVLVFTHHDSGPNSPGAHEAGSGPGLLIELARVFAHEGARARTLVFASFDGGNGANAAGARAYVAGLGAEGRGLVGALGLGAVGAKGAGPVVHTVARPDGLRPRGYVISPAWLVRAALAGAAAGDAPLPVGDATLASGVYAPAVRTFRVSAFSGDDAALLEAGHPALWLSDASPTSTFAWRDQPTDTPDKLDVESLARVGRAAHGALEELLQTARGPAAEPAWLAGFGRVFGWSALVAVGLLSLLPGLLRAFGAGGLGLAARLAQVVLFGLLVWRHPVVAVWVLLLPNLLTAAGSFWLSLVGLAPAFALVAAGVLGWQRGIVSGVWLEPWEIALLGLALAVALVPSRLAPGKRTASRAGSSPKPRVRRRVKR